MIPFIGIILRKSKSDSGREISVIYKDISRSVINSGGIPIGIPENSDIDLYLDLCQGFIFQGGDDIEEDSLIKLEKLRELDKPTLGICLGMQEMGYIYDGVIYDVSKHLNNLLHEIRINKDSLLYQIIKKEKILVNSRHKSAIKDTKLLVSGLSFDNVIESVEDPKLKFFLGVQWHPENLYDIDCNSKKLFDYFIKMCSE